MSNTVKQDLLADLSLRERGLKEQLKEIKALRAALKGVGEDDGSNERSSQTFAPSNTPTFKEMIVSVLSEQGRGAQATEILGLIKDKFGKEIKRSSISPQLSRLKSEGVIVLDDKVWYLPEHRVVPDVVGEAPLSSALNHIHPEDAHAYQDYRDEMEEERQRELRNEWVQEQVDSL